MKTRIGVDKAGNRWLHFWCPGCNEVHGPKIVGAGAWTWNGDRERPTIEPSILVTGVRRITDEEHDRLMAGEKIEPEPRRCHSFLRDGHLQFLADCTHVLAGQTVELPEYPHGDAD
jgi:hypothetical protein